MDAEEAIKIVNGTLIPPGWQGYIYSSNGKDFYPMICTESAWEDGVIMDLALEVDSE